MIVYRLSKTEWARDLSVTGAYLAGGRWNTEGISLLYTSENIALSVLEIAVNIPMGSIPQHYELVKISVPDNLPMSEIVLSNLPAGWREHKSLKATQAIGDAFIQSREYCILKVPSSIVPQEHNLLVNPLHQGFRDISIVEIEPFELDRRLFRWR